MSATTNEVPTSFSMSCAARLFAVLVTMASAPLAANAGQQADYFRNSGYRYQEPAGKANGTQEETKSADANTTQQENGDDTAADTEPKTVEEQLEATQQEVKDLKTELEEFLEAEEKAKKEKEEKPKSWFEKYRLNGYTQLRFNEDVDVDPGSARPQHVGDASVGDDRSFLIRRARLIISGDVTERISIYLQPDFVVTPPGSPDANQFVQVRDWYADLHFDKEKVYRIRVGQSKVPYGWENLQSSRNRLPLDRNDALNSAVRNERDLGAFFYYTPEYAQEFFKYTVDEGFKGSGNYGIFGLGLYNGQGGSFLEQNDNLHLVTRLTVPFNYNDCQMMEAGIQGYTGRYTVLSSPISPLGVGAAVRPGGTLEAGNTEGIRDDRVAATFVCYPQPFGFQTEWTVGRGPGLNDAQTAVIERPLYGGYAMIMYRMKKCDDEELIPFLRYNYYKGGYKTERNAPFSRIDEWELGTEWQLSKSLEFVAMYTWTDRTNTRAISSNNTLSYGQFSGDLIRLQLQFNY